jgi:hypothetical protein
VKEARPRVSAGLLWMVGIVVLTACEYAIVGMIQQGNELREEAAAAGVLLGHPHWRVYQGRILGPLLVFGTEQFTGATFNQAYKVVAAALLFAGNAVCFRLFQRTAGSAAWIYTGLCAACFIGLQDREWLYLWDYADVLVFLVFGWAVVTRAPPWVFVALFCCELLNREVAGIIALWMVIDAVDLRGSRIAVRWGQGLAGLALIGAGEAWLEFIRSRFFVSQVMVLPAGYRTMGDAIWMLPHNYSDLLHPESALDLMRVLIVFAVTGVLIKRAWAGLGERAWKVAAVLGVLIVSTLMFGRVIEMRVWLCVAPLWLWLGNITKTGAPADGAAVRTTRRNEGRGAVTQGAGKKRRKRGAS